MLVGAIDVLVRRVGNGPKAPSLRVGRFRSMPPRRPLVGGLKLVGSMNEAPAAWAQSLGDSPPSKAGRGNLLLVLECKSEGYYGMFAIVD
jgi:hypothetical protein